LDGTQVDTQVHAVDEFIPKFIQVEQVISTVVGDCPSKDVCQSSSVETNIFIETMSCLDEAELNDLTNKQVTFNELMLCNNVNCIFVYLFKSSLCTADINSFEG